MLSTNVKAIVASLMGLAIVLFQAIQGVYADGIDGLEWLGVILLVLQGIPVALASNSAYNPAFKAGVMMVVSVVTVVTQGIAGVYAGGISNTEWMGIGVILLQALAVYTLPDELARTKRT